MQFPMQDRREGQIPWELKLQTVVRSLTEVLGAELKSVHAVNH